MFSLDSFVRNQRSGGNEASQYLSKDLNNRSIENSSFDPGLWRPYEEKGKIWVDEHMGYEAVRDSENRILYNEDGTAKQQPMYDPQLVSERIRHDLPVINLSVGMGGMVGNATVLRKDQWIMIDRTVRETVRLRMRAYSDLRAANTFGGFDGMATPILEFEKLTDVGEAVVDMDGISDSQRNAAPTFPLQGMPLPITHHDFWLSSRFLQASRRNGGVGLDITRARQSARRVGEVIERTTIGTLAGITYGDDNSYEDSTPQVTGYVNNPDRLTSTGNTAPSGTNGTTILTEWLAQREVLTASNFFGPYMVYVATNWDQFLDNDFKTNSDRSVRERVMMIDGIQAIRRLDYLTTAGTTVWADFGTGLLQAVNGMEVTTVQWESKGGMQLNFKVMGIQVPRIMSVPVNTDADGGPAVVSASKSPVLHTTVA